MSNQHRKQPKLRARPNKRRAVTKRLVKGKTPSPVRAREAEDRANKVPTTAQLNALVMFLELMEKHGREPTRRELSEALGMTENGAQTHITQLTLKGCLEERKELVVVGRTITEIGKRWARTHKG